MINILVTINVKNFDALEVFERRAVEIMRDHDGNMVSVFEIERNPDGSGQEIHLIQFPDEENFLSYRTDSRLTEYADLRGKAIESMEVVMSSKVKSYS